MKPIKNTIMVLTLLTFSATSAYGYSEPLERLKAGLDNFGLGDFAYSDKIESRMVSTLLGMLKSNKKYNSQTAYNFVEKLSPKEPDIDWNDAKSYVRSVMTTSLDQNQYKILCGSVSLKYMAACLGTSAYNLEAVYLRGVDEDDIDVDWLKGDRYANRFLEANRENLSKLSAYYTQLDIVKYRSQILKKIENDGFSKQRYNESLKRQAANAKAQSQARAQKNKALYEAERRQRVSTENKIREQQQAERNNRVNIFPTEEKQNKYEVTFKRDFYRSAASQIASFNPDKDSYTINDQCKVANGCSNLLYTTGRIHPFTKGYKRWDVLESDYSEIAQTLGLRLNKITGIKLMAYHGDAFIAFKYNKIWFIHELKEYLTYSDLPGLNKKIVKMWKAYSVKVDVTYTEVINGIEYYTDANSLEFAGMQVGTI